MATDDSDETTLLAACGGRVRVLAVTGIRSEYDLLYPLLRALHEDPAFDLGVVVCGAHPTPLHNHSIDQIRADGLPIVEVIDNLLYSDSRAAKAKSAGLLVQGLAQTLAREAPDLLLVLGDREEPIATALAGAYMGIPVVHLAGGDHTCPQGGNVDEEVRHATSKLAHVHLTMAEAHSERLRRMGEEPWRIHRVGSGGIDRLRQTPVLPRERLAALLGEDVLGDYLVVIHHSVSSRPEQAAEEMRLILERCLAADLPVFVGAANSDPGSAGIASVIEEFTERPGIRPYRNLPREPFVSLLRHARCLLGNSSLGLHEAGYLGLPVINVGERQRGRLAGPQVQFVPAGAEAIDAALERALHDSAYREQLREADSLYGDGHMAERALAVLKGLPSRERLLAKTMTY